MVVEPDDHEFHAYCPALKGLHVFGESQSDALENAKIAISDYLESLVEHGEPIPVGPELTVLTQQEKQPKIPAWMIKEVSLPWPIRRTSGIN